MQKKKVAVVFNHLGVGGAEKALYNFLNEIDQQKFEVTLFTADLESEYLRNIPRGIHISSTVYPDSRGQLLRSLKTGHIFQAIIGFFFRIMIRVSKDNYFEYMWTQLSYPRFGTLFDCAIAYKMNFEDTVTALFRIKAKRKCAIMHSNMRWEKKIPNQFALLIILLDKIFCVSEDSRIALDEVYPVYRKKTQTMLNVICTGEIISKAADTVEDFNTPISICTVGRLSEEKGQTMIPQTMRLLLEAGYDLKWYLVGEGPTRADIEKLCRQYDVADRVILLGTKENPYPYIKNCTVYVQPSFSEGYCTTTMEAKILQKPVVTTDAPGMREQFVSGENGLIVDEMTPEALFEGIKTLLDHPEIRQKFIDNLSHETFDNSAELQKLYDFIES